MYLRITHLHPYVNRLRLCEHLATCEPCQPCTLTCHGQVGNQVPKCHFFFAQRCAERTSRSAPFTLEDGWNERPGSSPHRPPSQASMSLLRAIARRHGRCAETTRRDTVLYPMFNLPCVTCTAAPKLRAHLWLHTQSKRPNESSATCPPTSPLDGYSPAKSSGTVENSACRTRISCLIRRLVDVIPKQSTGSLNLNASADL